MCISGLCPMPVYPPAIVHVGHIHIPPPGRYVVRLVVLQIWPKKPCPLGLFGESSGCLGVLSGGLLGSVQGPFFDPRKMGPGRELPRPPPGSSGGSRGLLWESLGVLEGSGGVLGGSFGVRPGPNFRPSKNGPWMGAPEAAGGPVGGVGAAVGVLGRFLGCFGSFRTLFGADLWSRSDKNHFRPTLCFAQTHLS